MKHQEKKYLYVDEVFWGLIVSGIVLSGIPILAKDVWLVWAPAFFLVAALIRGLTYKKGSPLVINDVGITIPGKCSYSWDKMDHCYFSTKYLKKTDRLWKCFGLVIVTPKGYRSFIDLSNYSYTRNKLRKEINTYAQRNICVKREIKDREIEKEMAFREWISDIKKGGIDQ